MIIEKSYKDNINSVVNFRCDIGDCRIGNLKNLKIIGRFDNSHSEATLQEDFLEMDLSIKFNCAGKPLEIMKIFAGKNKGLGRGTLALYFLEKDLIPILNDIINQYFPGESIRYIYGIVSDLSDDTSPIKRLKFYNKNGYQIINSHFYKYF